MGRIIIPMYFCKSRVPLVLFRLEGDEKHVGIIDTGSEISMFDFSLKDSGMSEVNDGTETSFIGVNGSGKTSKVSQVKGDVTFKTKDDEHFKVKVDGVLFDFGSLTEAFQRRTDKNISISALFGSDFLKKYNARINYRNKTLTIDGVEE